MAIEEEIQKIQAVISLQREIAIGKLFTVTVSVQGNSFTVDSKLGLEILASIQKQLIIDFELKNFYAFSLK